MASFWLLGLSPLTDRETSRVGTPLGRHTAVRGCESGLSESRLCLSLVPPSTLSSGLSSLA